MKIKALHSRNWRRIEVLDVEPNGNHLVFFGPNGSGKTSAINLIWQICKKMAKARGPDIDMPVHLGAAATENRLELQDDDGQPRYIVDYSSDGDKDKIKVSNHLGLKCTSDEFTEGFFDPFCLDPGAYLTKKNKEKIDELLQVYNIHPPVEKVLQITGEAFPAKPGESAADYLDRIAGDSGELYGRRTQLNRILQQKEKSLAEHASRMNGLAKPPADATNIEALNQRRQELDVQRQTLGLASSALQAKLQQVQASKQRLAEYQSRREKLLSELAELDGRITKGNEIIGQLEQDVTASRAKLAELPDPADELKSIDANIQAHAANQKTILAFQELDRLKDEAAKAKDQHVAIDAAIKAIRQESAKLLDGIDLGIEGLAITAGQLTVGGVPFDNRSQAEKIKIACAIAFRRNPTLKILRLDDAEHLDAKSWALIRELADKNGWQCILTFVRDVDSLQFEIVEAKQLQRIEASQLATA